MIAAEDCPSSTIHGTVTAYTDHRCRCPKARALMAEGNARRLREGPALIDSTGTARRLQALSAASWPMYEIAARLGAPASQVREWAQGIRPTVHRRSAEKVAALYGELAHLDGGWAWRTAARAAAKGWVGPARWVGLDMDDPAVAPWPPAEWDPVVVRRLMEGSAWWKRDANRRERRQAVLWLRAEGVSIRGSAERLRMDPRAVVRDLEWLREHGLLTDRVS